MKPEYEAMIAGIPLMSPEEQSEVIEKVRAVGDSIVMSALENLQAGVNKASVEKRVARYVALRDARAANNARSEGLDKAFKNALSTIEKSLLADAQAQGVTGFKTEAGTTYIEEVMQASIADDEAFYGFVRSSGDLDFFERRIKVNHIKEFAAANEGRIPPGLNIFRELAMKFRRK